jgi:membrane fusion protein (multidrug efflux system)
MTDESGNSPASEVPANGANATARRKWLMILIIAVAMCAIGYGLYLLLKAPSEETDDAYVAGNTVAITAQDPGTVVGIYGDDTQMVRAGQPLVDLDPATADVELAAAEAQLARAVRAVRGSFLQVDGASAAVNSARAELDKARADLARRRQAAAAGAVSGEEVAHAADAMKTAAAALALAQSQYSQARAQVHGTGVDNNPAVLAAIADYRRAAIRRSHMHIAAPIDGVVAQRRVQIGQQIAAGSPLMAVVPLREVWVDANFRETQLKDLRIGQPVIVKTDIYGGDVKFHGRVAGLSAGSGNAFALLPPQNASGNWIKIVQRLPVRIQLDPKELDKHPLRIGLSVQAEVETSDRSGALLGKPASPLFKQNAVNPGDTAEVNARIAQIIAANRSGGR